MLIPLRPGNKIKIIYTTYIGELCLCHFKGTKGIQRSLRPMIPPIIPRESPAKRAYRSEAKCRLRDDIKNN